MDKKGIADGGETSQRTVPAGRLRPWGIDELPPSPPTGLRHWKTLVGPGLLMAGASIGAGEWLFGPAVSAQFGGTLLWLGTISIGCQVFMNLECMRYALYCGEPILVGYFRTFPGPWFWTIFYLVLEISSIWPFLAANAAVLLAAAILGHLPGDATTTLLGVSLSERQLVKVLTYAIFILSFTPLIFGGAVYRMIERIMTIKIVLVLGYFILITLFMVSGRNALEVVTGFFRFGSIPFRADTVIDGRHFTLTQGDASEKYKVQGTVEGEAPLVTRFTVGRDGDEKIYKMGEHVPTELRDQRNRLVRSAVELAKPGRFLVEHETGGRTLRVQGRKAADGSWEPTGFTVDDAGSVRTFDRLDQIEEEAAARFSAWIENRGLERRNIIPYIAEEGRLPPLDWALLAAFFSIAGAGGLSNVLLSNYARDKGWGMGAKVGAIPSAVGGRSITLSHTGKVFRVTEASRTRWRGWMRHLFKDQVVIWMLGAFLGLALPCMISLEFIRNAPISGNRVAAMTADGIATQYPAYSGFFWSLTLFIGFLVLAPGLVLGNDSISRRWTDIIWVCSKKAQTMDGNQVKLIYYAILTVFGIWGLFALSLLDPLQIAKLGACLGNVALGATALHTLYVNRTLLPRETRPGWFQQLGLLACGVCFLGITVIVVLTF